MEFTISDYQNKVILFDTRKQVKSDDSITTTDDNLGAMEFDIDMNAPMTEDSFRKIKYTFSEKVLSLPLIKTS